MTRFRGLLSDYSSGDYFCELLGAPVKDGAARDGAAEQCRAEVVVKWLERTSLAQLQKRAKQSERELYNLGITFTVYSQAEVIDRILPFDMIPHILTAQDWRQIETGVSQRIVAINHFLQDIYGKGLILRDGIVPKDLVLGNANYRLEMRDVKVRHGTYMHIGGIDIVRDQAGDFCVLEDNRRTPSGVSYVIENRHLMQRTFPDLLDGVGVRGVHASRRPYGRIRRAGGL